MGDDARGDVAAGAATVLDHDVLMQALAQALPDHARQRVGDTARRKGNDEGDLVRRIGLSVGAPCGQDEQ